MARASKKTIARTRLSEEKDEDESANVQKESCAGLAWCGVAILSASIAIAQDTAPQNDPAAQNMAPVNAGQATAATGGQRSDGQIEMDVVHALDAAQPLKKRPDYCRDYPERSHARRNGVHRRLKKAGRIDRQQSAGRDQSE